MMTYLPPLLPIVIWWDGLASTLKTHSAAELRKVVAGIAAPGYSWSIEEIDIPGAPIPVLQVVGVPDVEEPS